jgi:hypothetical protein
MLTVLLDAGPGRIDPAPPQVTGQVSHGSLSELETPARVSLLQDDVDRGDVALRDCRHHAEAQPWHAIPPLAELRARGLTLP